MMSADRAVTLRAALLSVVALLGLSCRPEITGQETVRRALQDAYDPGATWTVALLRDSRHLLIQAAGAYFGTRTDSLFDRDAREIVRIALRRYPSAAALDSITVSVGQSLSGGNGIGVFRVGRSLTLPVGRAR